MEEYKRAFKGIWIPKEIWESKNLSIMEKIMLVEIDSLDNEEGCFASNKYFSDFFELSKGRVSQIINNLIDKEYLNAEYERNGKQTVKRILKIQRPPYPIEIFNKLNRGIKFSKEGYLENCKDNNIINNNINNKKEKKEKTKTEFDVIIDKISNEELKNTLYEFIKMRKTIKKPLTTRALQLILNKLDDLADNEEQKIDILNQSIMNNWLGVFPLKINYIKVKEENKKNEKPKEREKVKVYQYELLTEEEYAMAMRKELPKERLEEIAIYV